MRSSRFMLWICRLQTSHHTSDTKTVPSTISFLNPISWNLQLRKVDSSTLCDLGMFTFIFIQQSSEDLNHDNPRIKTRQQNFVWKVTHDIKFTSTSCSFCTCSLKCIALPLSEKEKLFYVNRRVVERVMPHVNQSLLHPILSLTAHASC